MRGISKSYIIILIIHVIILDSTEVFYAQERASSIKDSDFPILSYQEIREQEFLALEQEDWKKLSQLVNFHISKAKAENNKIEIARAYYYKTDLHEPDIALK